MTLDDGILQDVRASRDALEYCEDQVYEARARFHQEVRRLHAAGGSMREIATALGMSHQRVHQIIGEDGIVEVEATATDVPALPTSTSLAVTATEDRCSFCGAPRRELDTLLAAPGPVFICSSCVERVGPVVNGEPSEAARTVPATEGATCSFCRSDSAVRGRMAESTRNDVRICARCIATCQQMMRTNEPRRPAMHRTGRLRCSFCNVSQTETKKLVAGPGVYICDGCIVAAGEVTRTGHRVRGPRSAVLVSAITEEAPCQFCGKSPLAVGGMARGGRGRICDECIELCVDILSEEAGRQ